jgi:hypothetical protein
MILRGKKRNNDKDLAGPFPFPWLAFSVGREGEGEEVIRSFFFFPSFPLLPKKSPELGASPVFCKRPTRRETTERNCGKKPSSSVVVVVAVVAAELRSPWSHFFFLFPFFFPFVSSLQCHETRERESPKRRKEKGAG